MVGHVGTHRADHTQLVRRLSDVREITSPKLSRGCVACCAFVAGGGMNTGQVIGATDRNGGEAADRPVDFQEVFATLYQNVGIDVRTATVDDLSGRPRYLVDQKFKPMPELVG